MLVLGIALTMVASLVTATAITLHNEADKARIKAVAKKNRILN